MVYYHLHGLRYIVQIDIEFLIARFLKVTGIRCLSPIFIIKVIANAVFPTAARPVMVRSWPRGRPPVSLSKSVNPVVILLFFIV